jgi:hypothetical protein
VSRRIGRRAAGRALRLELVTPEQRVYIQLGDGTQVPFYADALLALLVFAGDLDTANRILDVLERGKVPVIEPIGADGEFRLWDARVVPMQRGGAA